MTPKLPKGYEVKPLAQDKPNRRRQVLETIALGIELGHEKGFNKSYDLALSVVVCLEEHGFRVTRKHKQ